MWICAYIRCTSRRLTCALPSCVGKFKWSKASLLPLFCGTGAIRFEAAAQSEEEDSPSASDYDYDSDTEGSSGSSEGFSFSDTDSDIDVAPKQQEKGKETVEKVESGAVDMEDLEALGDVQKRRREMPVEREEKAALPVATLRRQAAKSEAMLPLLKVPH